MASKDAGTREQATNRVIALRDTRAVPMLTPLCRNPLAAVHACKALAHLGSAGVEALLKLRHDAARWVRLQAIGGLGWSKDPRAIAALKVALRDPDADSRRKALYALLRNLPAAEHRQLTVNMLQDSAPSCRVTAVILLSNAAKLDATLYERLLPLANDPDAEVRDLVLDRFCVRDDPRLFDAMCSHWLLSENIDHVARAVSWLGGIGDPWAAPLLRKVYDHWVPRLPAPGAPEATEYPDNYIPDLLDRLTKAMAATDDAGSTDFLYALTKDPHPLIRVKAMGAFLELVDTRGPEVMAAALRDPDAEVREELTQYTFRFVGHPAVQGVLRAMCADADPLTRTRGLKWVRFATPDEALARLEPALSDTDADVRATAMGRLGSVDDPRAIDRLLALAASPDRAIRRTALGALTSSGAPRVVDLLLPLLQKPSRDRQWLLVTLQYARISDPRLDAALLALLPRCDSEERYCIYRHFEFNPTTRATPALLQALTRETDGDLRMTILEALGNCGDPAAADALLAFVRNPKEADLHQQAYEALGRTHDPRALPLLLARRKAPGDKWGVIRGLGQYQDARVYEALLPLINHSNPNYRELALSYLGNTGDPRALPVLIAALTRRNIYEASAAACGLQLLGPARAQEAIDPLIAALARMRKIGDRVPFARALTTLTNQDFGLDAQRWQAWRQQTRDDGVGEN